MQRIAFIGAGIMGKSMVRNLKKVGFTVQIYARHPEKVAELVQEGIELFSTIGDCVKEADAVITIVGFPSDVEEVYFGSGNILDSAKKGACLIDMTTTSPELRGREKAWSACSGCAGHRWRYRSEERHPLDSGRGRQGRLRILSKNIRGNGKKHQILRTFRLRSACQGGQPDHGRGESGGCL